MELVSFLYITKNNKATVEDTAKFCDEYNIVEVFDEVSHAVDNEMTYGEYRVIPMVVCVDTVFIEFLFSVGQGVGLVMVGTVEFTRITPKEFEVITTQNYKFYNLDGEDITEKVDSNEAMLEYGVLRKVAAVDGVPVGYIDDTIEYSNPYEYEEIEEDEMDDVVKLAVC